MNKYLLFFPCLLLATLFILNYWRWGKASCLSDSKIKHFKVALFTKATTYHENAMHGFMEELRREKEVDFEVKIYWTESQNQALSTALVEEAISEGCDAICPIGALLSQVAYTLTNKREKPIPVIFMGASDPESLGLVRSVESSGNNVTGVNMNNKNDFMSVHIFHLLKPDAKHVLLPYCSLASGGNVEEEAYYVKEFLEKRGVRVTLIPIYRLPEILDRVRSLIYNADTVMYLVGCSVTQVADGLIKLCDQHGATLFCPDPALVRSGAACGFGPDSELVGRRGFHVMRKVLVDGIRPTDIPVEFLEKGRRIAVNLTAAKKQNLRVPEDILLCLSRGVVYD